MDEEQNKNDLQTDRLVAQTYRDLFLKYNKPWMQSRCMRSSLPRPCSPTVRTSLLSSHKVMGDLAPDISVSEKGKKDEEDSNFLLSDDNDDEDIKQKKQAQKVKNEQEKQIVKENTSVTSKAIIKFWIIRARLKQKVRI